MAIQTINIGTTANDGTGDDPRTAGDKINDNFTNSTHAASRDVGTASGNVMEVGAGGLLIGKQISDVNANERIVPGKEFWGTGSTDIPISATAFIADITSGSVAGVNNRNRQVASSYSASKTFERFSNDGGLTWSGWFEFYTTSNTTVDGSGFIKEASPIVKLFSDKIELNDYKEIENCTFERVDTGHYIINGAPLLSRNGWYIETLKDRNNNIYFTLDYEELEDGLHIKTYEPDYSTGRATNGAPVDINDGRFVTLRFEEDKIEE